MDAVFEEGSGDIETMVDPELSVVTSALPPVLASLKSCDDVVRGAKVVVVASAEEESPWSVVVDAAALGAGVAAGVAEAVGAAGDPPAAALDVGIVEADGDAGTL